MIRERGSMLRYKYIVCLLHLYHVLYLNFYITLSAFSVRVYALVEFPNLILHWAQKVWAQRLTV